MVLDYFTATRQNHALEHATIAILSQRSEKPLKLAGRATPRGFYIYGDVSTPVLAEAAREGLKCLQKGEVDLAISPFCGTNIAVAGTLAGISAAIAVGKGKRQQRLPYAILAATAAIMLAIPLGRLAQQYLTTSVNVEGLHISKVTRRNNRGRVRHMVRVSRES